ncbi:MAG: hypothetical protein CM15mP22_2880 [Gammaproteobacteria bacterium]|nr:MAG: hypothetical protein CM15mP22_2880 [Gammaproteobacteria bacterium]
MATPTLRQIKMSLFQGRLGKHTPKNQGKLSDRGFGNRREKYPRDLVALEQTLPLVCDSRDKPYGWSWAKGSEGIQAPAMDPVGA